jgi:murein endopeptidase
MRGAADNLSPGPLSRRLTLFAAVSAVLGMITCVAVPAEDSAPLAMQSAMVAGADLPDSNEAPARAPTGAMPLAIPITAAPAEADQAASEGSATPELEAESEELEDTPSTIDPRLQEVFWTAHQNISLDALAIAWGVQATQLVALNPELDRHATVAEGTRLRVYRYDPEHPPQSIGSPNRGKLRNGMPLPEGPGWRLRTHRPRTYGTTNAITALVDAFSEFTERYPDGPKIRVGELARRTGGRVPPHRSHRTGRDIDIGYIFRGIDDGEHRWQYMNARNFDAEKNWALIDSLLKTGQVQTIYISKSLQKLLHKEAQKHLDEEQLAALFEYPRTPNSPHAVIQHWRGHSNHMHVRFRCEPGNRRCKARSA